MSVKHIKDIIDFKNTISSNQKIIVDFYANWCGPCKMMSPIFEELSEERRDITFVKVNVDELSDVAQEYSIASIPTLISFWNAKEVSKHVGFLTKDQINNFLNKVSE